jgi:hypothetical protein
VEEAIGRKLHVSYSANAANAEDITFSAATAPAGWRPSDIRANVGMILRDAICQQVPQLLLPWKPQDDGFQPLH